MTHLIKNSDYNTFYPLNIKGFEKYSVNKNGEIKSYNNTFYINNFRPITRMAIILKKRISKKGYYRVNIYNEFSKMKSIHLHRAVAITFLENLENKPCINHIDGIKTNNIVDNLEWCTYKENSIHAIEKGLYVNKLQGENSGTAILTNEIVLNIRNLYNSGLYSQREIGRMLNIKYKNINQIVLRKRWRHI
jgi:hypothetical protein